MTTAEVYDTTSMNLSPFILASLLLVTVLHTLASVSRLYTQLILATLRVLLFGALMLGNPPAPNILSAVQEALLSRIPLDVRTVLSKLQLEPTFITYTTCPACFAIYPPNDSQLDDPYPHTCTHKKSRKHVCGTPLVFTKKLVPSKKSALPRVVHRSILLFPYYPMKSYLATLLMRLGVEDLLETSWQLPDDVVNGSWKNIIHSPAIQELLGPDRKTPFSVQHSQDLHLVFGLFVDWFNPHMNKRGGKSHSVGGIYMVCLNLPPHLRFRPEYMYLVAVIPGPREPDVTELNHLICPLIDELEKLWDEGYHIKKT